MTNIGQPLDNVDLECTWWPEGWWHHCCVQHDLGLINDNGLFQCVVDSGPNVHIGLIIGFIMLVGLTLGRPIYRYLTKGENNRG